MKKIFSAMALAVLAILASCEAFEDGTVSAYDYAGYNPYTFYNGPYLYNNYPFNNPWDSPIYSPGPPPPPAINIPAQRPSRPIVTNPTNPQAPSSNGLRPGSNGSQSIVPSGNNNPFASQTQNWTTMPTNNGRRPGAR